MTDRPLSGRPLSDRPLRVGLLGAGMIATAPHGFLPGMAELAGRAQVVAVSSRSIAKAEAAARAFRIPQVFATLDEMLAEGHLDAVINATSIEAHFETSMRILAAGKHLVSEKPLALTGTEARQLVARGEESGVQLVVAPSRMLEPSRQRARRLIDAGAIGPVHSARIRVSHAGPGGMPWPTDPRPGYAADAGPLRDMAPYALEQAIGLLGPIRRVSAMTARSRASFPAYGEGPFAGVEVHVQAPDIVQLLLETTAGCLVSAESSFGPVQSAAPHVELYGTDGTINLHTRYGDDARPRIELHRRGIERPGEWIDPSTPADHERQRALDRLARAVLVEHLVDSLDAGAPPQLSGARGADIVRLIEAAERSAASGRHIDLAD